MYRTPHPSSPARVQLLSLVLLGSCALMSACTSGGGGGGSSSNSSVAPTLTSLSPTSGPSQGGSTVTLSGSGFNSGTIQVFFGGTSASSTTVINDRTLSCTTPAGTNLVDVRVTNSKGESALVGAFSYGALPVIDALNPASASSIGGTTIVLSGSNFGTSLVSVTFAGVPATELSVSDTSVSCKLPPGYPGDIATVSVTSVDGVASLAGGFRYHTLPSVASIAPDSVFDGGARSFSILGMGFEVDEAGTNLVQVGGQLASSVTRVGDHELVVEAPSGSTGFARDVTVSNDNGFDTATAALTSFPFPPLVQASDSRLDGSGTGVSSPTLALNGAEVYVAWLDSRTGAPETYFRRSVDHGSTWGAVTLLSTSSNPSSGTPQIAVAGSSVVVAWEEDPAGGSNNELFVRRSTDGGASWPTSPIRLDGGASENSRLGGLFVLGDRLFLTWEQGYKIAVAHSADAGGSWSSPSILTGNIAYGPKVVATPEAVHVAWAWQPNGSTPFVLQVRSASLTGGPDLSFGSAVTVSSAGSGESAHDPAFAVTADGAVHVAFEEASGSGSFVRVNRTADAGQSWLATPVSVRSGVGDVHSLGLIALGDVLCTSWGAPSYTELEMSRSTDGGQNWTEVSAPLSTGNGAANRPRLAASGQTLVLGFVCTRYGYDDPFMNVSLDAGATWLSADIRLDDDFRFSALSSIVVDGARIHAVWPDNRSVSTNQLYYNRTMAF